VFAWRSWCDRRRTPARVATRRNSLRTAAPDQVVGALGELLPALEPARTPTLHRLATARTDPDALAELYEAHERAFTA
jgi:hypothetical protein